MVSPEELLRPRFKVIADYPHSPYAVGDLLKTMGETSFLMTATPYRDEFGEQITAEHYVKQSTIEGYKNLFRPLAWWEERKPEDMPEYVKLIEYDRRFFVYHSDEDPIPGDYPKLETIFKTGQDFQWVMTDKIPYALLNGEQGYELSADTIVPATEAEYLTYKNKNNEKS